MALAMTLLPFALLVLGFPIVSTLLITSAIVLYFYFPIPPAALHQVMFGDMDSFVLLAIPFFVFTGEVMGQGGISRRLVFWTQSLFGRTKGSLPMTSVGSCVVFGAISGSAPATIAAVGRITHAPMLKAGYSPRFATGLLTASGLIDNVIPPSVALILYGVIAEVSVVRLFTAGFIPGLVIALFFFAYIMWMSWRAPNVDRGEPFKLRRFVGATRESIWALLMPVVIMGGIYSGMFSATEAGGIASVYAVIVSVFIYREIDFRGLYDATCRAAFITSQLMIIIGAAGVYSWLLTTSGVAGKITALFTAADLAPWTILLFINVLLLVVGFFLDPPAAIPLMVPILLPIVKAANIDLVHFGIIVTVNLSIGMFTPPFGANIFVAQAVFKQPLSVIYTGVIPFTIISVLALLVITYVPEISLWLTRLHD